MGANSWYTTFPPSDPLDVGAGDRYKKREARMKDPLFLASCELAGIPATPRQARKYNQRKGLASLNQSEAKKLL